MVDTMHTIEDCVVIGLGAMGSAALYQLARRGVRAIGIDRFAPPHGLGSSHGLSRITRQAVGEGATCAPFVLRSQAIWRELEEATGLDLFHACGVLIMGGAAGKHLHHGKFDFVARSVEVAGEFGIPHEVLGAEEIARRFPQFTGLSGDERAYFEPGGGYVVPEACIAAQLRRAAELGAEIRTGCKVTGLAQQGDLVELRLSGETIRARRAIVCAGAWTAELVGEPFTSLLSVSRQVLHWFKLDDMSAYGPQSPAFIWMHGSGEVDYLYGFPPEPGTSRIKVATEQYETRTNPGSVERSVDPAESAEMFRRHVQGRLAGTTAEAVETAACLYTTTPDRAFIIDRHPDLAGVTVVSACSGHGFKHSAAIGEALAESVADGRSRFDLSPFSLSRFGGKAARREAADAEPSLVR